MSKATDKLRVREFLSQYGAKLREKRKQIKFTQLQVAEIIGCSQAIISHIECGYMLPPPHIEKALIELYKILRKAVWSDERIDCNAQKVTRNFREDAVAEND